MTWYAPYYDEFASALLASLQAPVVRGTLDPVIAWIGGEAGWTGSNVAVKGNNPLNIKAGTFRSYGIAVDGIRNITNVDDGTQGYGTFSSLERGAAATAEYLQRGTSHGYDKAIAALKRQDAAGFLDAIARSDWAASHYGLPGTNHLLTNLAYVRRATPSADPKSTPTPRPVPKPEVIPVKFIQLSGADLERLESIAVPEGTPIEDFAGEPWDTIGPTNVRVLPGLVDAHANRRAVVVSTARFYQDGKARPTAQVAVLGRSA